MGLVFRNVSKSYGAVVAIRQADMEIERGEVRAILGGNGSGKSTLAKIAGGLIGKDTGEILLDEEKIDFSSPKEAKKHQVIMTSQELSLFGNLTVEENISICDVPRRAGFTDKKALKKKARDILASMNLESIVGKKVSELAANQQYMVELAKALAQDPKILLIDEITSALYREDVDIVCRLLSDLKKKGCIILFISHRMAELYAICDSVTIMRNGETLGTYQMEEKTEDELLSLMVGTKVESYHGEGRHKGERKRDVFLKAPQIRIPSYGTEESLEIGKGEIIGVAGLQGHGQTELIRALYGMYGEISLEKDGQPLTIHSPREAVRQGFAFISGDRERDGTFRERSLAENVLAVQQLVKNQKAKDAKEILDGYNVRYDHPGQLITDLSGGNQQKVVVGRWLSTEPTLLLADDPSKGIDVKARNDLHREFARLAGQGSAVIMISSDDDELVNITSMSETSRVIVLYEGKISAVLTGDAISRENISAASMPINAIPDEQEVSRS